MLPQHQVLTTDASLLGWGSHVEGVLAQGTWTVAEAQHSINLLELCAVCLALSEFHQLLQGAQVLVHTECVSKVIHLQAEGHKVQYPALRSSSPSAVGRGQLGLHQGKTPGGSEKYIGRLAEQESHAGVRIAVASRDLPDDGLEVWNPSSRSICLSRQQATGKVLCKVSRAPSRGSGHRSGRPPGQRGGLFYAFSPIALIPLLLRKVWSLGGEVVLIALWWPWRL